MSLLFNKPSSFIIAFVLRSKHLLNFMAAVPICCDLGAQENSLSLFPLFLHLPWSDGTGCHDLHFLNVEFQTSFFTLLFHLHLESLWFPFAFCRKSDVICISDVIDIPAILIPACAPSSLAFLMMYFA